MYTLVHVFSESPGDFFFFFVISESATDGSLPSENWTLNMEICDIINETEDGPKDAIKAIKRRFNQAAGKNYTIVMYTLTVSIIDHNDIACIESYRYDSSSTSSSFTIEQLDASAACIFVTII